MLPRSFYKKNRQNLFSKSNVDCIIVAAAGLMQRNSDCAYPFRQDSNFLYLTGCNEPDLLLVITKDTHYLVLPKRQAHRDIWEGSLSPSDLTAASGVDNVLPHKEGWLLINQLAFARRVGVILPPKQFLASYGMYTNPTRTVLHNTLKRKKAKEENQQV